MTALGHTQTLPERPAAGETGYELARYALAEGERVLVGRRVRGVAIVVDAPVGEDGRVYLVERNVQIDGYAALRALVADYVTTATSLGRTPMARTGSAELGERAS
ncbi:MAG: hypothetical protein ACRDL5_03255 [Solirubrobacteraceae bacterium]